MWIVKLEAFLLVMVLLCTALLRQEIPARHAAHLKHHAALPAAVEVVTKVLPVLYLRGLSTG
jgi:hypothetical protein